MRTLRAVVDANPENATARHDLSRAYYALGEVERATRELRRALRIRNDLRTLRFLATIAAFDPRLSPRAVLRYRTRLHEALRVRCAERISAPRSPAARAVLRVGYLSSFFSEENWMKSVWCLVDHHDRRRVEVHLFSDCARSRIAHLAARGRRRQLRVHDISRHDNDRAARAIARSGVDVLVDLNGFSRSARLPLFVMKPAPVQVAWFNVLGTLGMPTFDALVGDPWVARDGDERFYAEPIMRLPVCNQTFDVTYPTPDVQPPPCLENGHVTFGSLAPMYKLDRQTLRAWAAILRRCPTSRLLLANSDLSDAGNRTYLAARFARLGVETDRLTLRGGAPHRAFLENYDGVDIALDTLVYGGGTTTIEAIWQGVPVIACGGDRWVSRQAVSILTYAGLQRFVHPDPESYVDAAVAWARSPTTPNVLKRLRSSLRSRLKKSAVCDCAGLARRMEDIYRRLHESAAVR